MNINVETSVVAKKVSKVIASPNSNRNNQNNMKHISSSSTTSKSKKRSMQLKKKELTKKGVDNKNELIKKSKFYEK